MLVLAGLVILWSCTTYYGPRNLKGGYSEKQLNNAMVQVTFVGNQQATADEIRTLLTYRCAEVTIEQGFNYFTIQQDDSYDKNGRTDFAESRISVSTTSSLSGGTHTAVINDFTPESTNSNIVGVFTIKMLAKPDPAYPAANIDAQTFIAANEHLIHRK